MSHSPATDPLPLTVFDGAGRDRIALSAWRVMFHELWQYRELIHRLLMRSFTGQFRQSFLGYFWIILPPFATTVIFSLLRRAQVMNVSMEGHTMPYEIFALLGSTVWAFFTQVVLAATRSINNAGSLVSKIYFPREVLVLSDIGNALINTIIRFVMVAVSFLLLAYAPHWQVIFLPVVMLPLLALALGLGLLFAPINTMMHDMGRLMEFAFQFGLFLAPVVYPTPSLANSTGWPHVLAWVHLLNPVSHFLYASHALIETGALPITNGLIVSSALGFLTLAVGWRFFHICEPLLAERL